MKFTVIIPARFASSRLPGKPLCDIAGKSMIERVYLCAKKSLASKVIVATDHADIVKEVKRFGGEVCLTSAQHESGTDRLAEVVTLASLDDHEIVVNVQGDEPLIPPAVINQVAKNLHQDSRFSAATLSENIDSVDVLFNPNAVKVVKNTIGNALYFSRAPIPWSRDDFSADGFNTVAQDSLVNEKGMTSPLRVSAQRHIGIYAYKVSLLKKFVTWPMSDLEHTEKLEQLRILDNNHQIHVETACEAVPAGVDTQEDLERLRLLLSEIV